MATIELTKKISFEAAHRLGKGYKGPCKNIHGHSWNVELTVQCEELNTYDMGIDFDEISQFNRQIKDEFDHKLILYKEDIALINVCKKEGYELVIMNKNPTSEVIAAYIFEKADTYFSNKGKGITILSVTIEETCTSRCVWKR